MINRIHNPLVREITDSLEKLDEVELPRYDLRCMLLISPSEGSCDEEYVCVSRKGTGLSRQRAVFSTGPVGELHFYNIRTNKVEYVYDNSHPKYEGASFECMFYHSEYEVLFGMKEIFTSMSCFKIYFEETIRIECLGSMKIGTGHEYTFREMISNPRDPSEIITHCITFQEGCIKSVKFDVSTGTLGKPKYVLRNPTNESIGTICFSKLRENIIYFGGGDGGGKGRDTALKSFDFDTKRIKSGIYDGKCQLRCVRTLLQPEISSELILVGNKVGDLAILQDEKLIKNVNVGKFPIVRISRNRFSSRFILLSSFKTIYLFDIFRLTSHVIWYDSVVDTETGRNRATVKQFHYSERAKKLIFQRNTNVLFYRLNNFNGGCHEENDLKERLDFLWSQEYEIENSRKIQFLNKSIRHPILRLLLSL